MTMELVPIEVECYAGFKADESPRFIRHFNERLEIREVLDRWYQKGTNPEFAASNYFKVETLSGEQYLLKHELEKDEWFLCL